MVRGLSSVCVLQVRGPTLASPESRSDRRGEAGGEGEGGEGSGSLSSVTSRGRDQEKVVDLRLSRKDGFCTTDRLTGTEVVSGSPTTLTEEEGRSVEL